jgi:hypothetical protein
MVGHDDHGEGPRDGASNRRSDDFGKIRIMQIHDIGNYPL